MPLVVAAFETISQAEAAVRSTLDAGYQADAMRAAGRVGGGRLLLADRVAVQSVGQPAKLADRAERAGGAAIVGALGDVVLVLAAAFVLRLRHVDLLASLRGLLPEPFLLVIILIVSALVGAAVGALSLRSSGLPHDLALRYARRLDNGDVVVGVHTADDRQARAVHESLAIHGAAFAHVTRGEVESVVDGAAFDDEAGLAGPVLN